MQVKLTRNGMRTLRERGRRGLMLFTVAIGLLNFVTTVVNVYASIPLTSQQIYRACRLRIRGGYSYGV